MHTDWSPSSLDRKTIWPSWLTWHDIIIICMINNVPAVCPIWCQQARDFYRSEVFIFLHGAVTSHLFFFFFFLGQNASFFKNWRSYWQNKNCFPGWNYAHLQSIIHYWTAIDVQINHWVTNSQPIETNTDMVICAVTVINGSISD